MSKRTLLLILAALLTGAPLLAGQAKPPAKPAPAKPAPAKTPPAPPATPTPGAGPIVVVETVKGTFEFETYPNEAPRTVEHVLNLVKKGFYNGIRFHRVEPGFVIQAGDPNTRDYTKKDIWGTGGSGTPVGVSELSRKHNRYDCLLKMARDGNRAKSVIVVRAQGKTIREAEEDCYRKAIECCPRFPKPPYLKRGSRSAMVVTECLADCFEEPVKT